MSRRRCGKALEEDTVGLIHHIEDASIFDSELTADRQKIADVHKFSGAQDLEVRSIVKFFEELFLPRCDLRSCALTDGFATVNLMTAPI